MVAASGIVKLTARTAIKGKLFRCCILGLIILCSWLVCLYIPQLLTTIIGSSASLIFFLSLCLTVFLPLLFGFLYYLRRLQWGADDNIILIFRYFSSPKLYKKVVRIIFAIVLRIVGAAVVIFLPSFAVRLFSDSFVYSLIGMNTPEWAGDLSSLAGFLNFLGTIVLIGFSLRYYLAPFLFVADELMDPAEAVHMSTVISHRTKYDFVGFLFSFLLWGLAGIFMVPCVYSIPYFAMSYLVHCRFAIAQYNKMIDELNARKTPSFAPGF